jgi:hypothetical protein
VTLIALIAFVRKHELAITRAALLLFLAAFAFHIKHHKSVGVVVTLPPVEHVRTVTVEKQVLTTKTIAKADPALAAQLKGALAENAKLKADVTAATVATAESVSHGGGALTAPTTPQSEPTTAAVRPVHFEDFRLTFDANDTQARYTLHQMFAVVATTGRRKDGSALNLVKLYEMGPGTVQTELPITMTTDVITDQTAPHWMKGFGIQAGVAASGAAAGGTALRNGVVAAQWLSHGRTKAPEDQRYTILEPAVLIGGGVTDVGIIPAAFNLGSIKHQPLTNLWVGPYVSRSRFGGVLTVKF